MAITCSEDFAVEEFWDAVETYRARWKLSTSDLSDMMGVDRSNFQTSYKYRRPPSFTFVLRLAIICDLDINKFNEAKKNVVL